jgi:hypothetical protein
MKGLEDYNAVRYLVMQTGLQRSDLTYGITCSYRACKLYRPLFSCPIGVNRCYRPPFKNSTKFDRFDKAR